MTLSLGERELSKAWQRVQVLIDGKIGLIKEVVAEANPPGVPPLFRYRAVRNTVRDLDGRVVIHKTTDGFGYKRTSQESMLSAVGEAVERYCCTITKGRQLIHANYASLPGAGVNPLSVARLAREQYQTPGLPFRNVDRDTPMLWIQGSQLLTGETAWVPADLVFLPPPQSGTTREPISTGLACGSTYWHAAYAALCEYVERDAFTIMWLMEIPLPRVELDTIRDPACQEILREFQAYGTTITINDLTTDIGIPVFMVTGETQGWPRVWVSAAASLDPVQALRNALDESFGCLCSLLLSSKRIHTPQEVRTLDDHMYYYAGAADTHALDFYLHAPAIAFNEKRWAPHRPKTFEEACGIVGQLLQLSGCEAYLVDLTTPDVARADLHVVRAVVPELQFMHNLYPCLECPRMWRMATRMGVEPRTPNMTLHPFP